MLYFMLSIVLCHYLSNVLTVNTIEINCCLCRQ